MISHLVATALTTVALAATGAPAEQTGNSVTHIGTAIAVVGGVAPASIETGNALALVGNASTGIVR